MTKRLIAITGASRGLGAAFAVGLAGQRAHIVAVARTAGALEELDDRIRQRGGSATCAVLDIADGPALERLCRTVFDRWGRLDSLIHAAIHAPPLSPVAHSDDAELLRSMQVNCMATGKLIACAEPLLRRSESPRAVFFDDDRAGRKFFGAYGSSKAAQISLARSWQRETEGSRLAVRILKPRPMRTGLRARFFPGEAKDALAAPEDEAARLAREIDPRR